MERCTQCKLDVSQCHLYSSDRALLTAQEEEEYLKLKDHMVFNTVTGCLEAKYPFNADPSCLENNGRQAKACQVSQERWQLSNGSHSKYVEQFCDMVSRGVVSPFSQQEL